MREYENFFQRIHVNRFFKEYNFPSLRKRTFYKAMNNRGREKLFPRLPKTVIQISRFGRRVIVLEKSWENI